MAASEAQKRATKKWEQKNVDRISVVVTKGEKERIKDAAGRVGESTNKFIKTAINERIERIEDTNV